jgi:hypothetical protein
VSVRPHIRTYARRSFHRESHCTCVVADNGLLNGSIGAWNSERTATIARLPPAPQRPAIVWYGTSILQGAMAGRPGHQFTNVVARELEDSLGFEMINFGFSASGTMELSVAKYLTSIKQPVAAYIIE